MAFESSCLAFLIPSALFLIAIYFFTGRGTMLISGYNTLPKEERARYDTRALTRAMGIFTLIMAVLMAFILYTGLVVKNTVWALVGFICVFVFTGVWLVYMNKSKKLKAEED